MTRLPAWATVNQLFMALNNTGDERHAREGKVRIVIIHKPDVEARCTATVRQTKNSSLSTFCEAALWDGYNQQLRMRMLAKYISE